MYSMEKFQEFYADKTILITGHNGFKGSWLCAVLSILGAKVYGYSLASDNQHQLFSLMNISDDNVHSYTGDVRNLENLQHVFEEVKPEIVIHMAAQPLVRESYVNPVYTYETNVMGTVNVLECCRNCDSVKSVVNVTTDKVYRNNEWDRGYVETDYLDGYDPYSNSKSCSELVTHSYIQSFFNKRGIPVSTCRAGNVIGGGDFAKDRIVPDCYRAAKDMEDIVVRNPYSTRPYQHVLEPLFVYLMIAMRQYNAPQVAGSYNVGPNDESCVNTGKLVDLFVDRWNEHPLSDCEGNPRPELKWVNISDGGPHEANFLKLDCTKLKTTFDWSPAWNIETTMDKTVEWYRTFVTNGDIKECMKQQIKEYMECLNK